MNQASFSALSTGQSTHQAAVWDIATYLEHGGLDGIARIAKAQRSGMGCLPYRLGLDESQYRVLCRFLPEQLNANPEHEQEDLRQELLEMRRQEWQELVELIRQYRRGHDDSELWLAQILAAACLGSHHLWADLGLANRDELRQLISAHFPALIQLNDKDMRWKKFFYRQLCEQGGHFVCRSPTCETCSTYEDCFGEE